MVGTVLQAGGYGGFNVSDENWIPMADFDGVVKFGGVRDALVLAHRFKGVNGEDPLGFAAMMRMLIAFAHRTHKLDSEENWLRVWKSGKFDKTSVDEYLDRWRKRLFVFDRDYPFMQDANLVSRKSSPAARLVAFGDQTPVGAFGPSTWLSGSPHLRDVGETIRMMLRALSFDVMGIKASVPGEKHQGSLTPLCGASVVLVEGSNFFETVMLNSGIYEKGPASWQVDWRDDSDDGEDLPLWERPDNSPLGGAVRMPNGYLDYLTWQARKILLFPELEGEELGVRRSVLANGEKLPVDFIKENIDPMLLYRWVGRGDKRRCYPLGMEGGAGEWRQGIAMVVPEMEEGMVSCGNVDRIRERGLLDAEPGGGDVVMLSVIGQGYRQARFLFANRVEVRIPRVLLNSDGDGARKVLRVAADMSWQTVRTCGGQMSKLVGGVAGKNPRRDAEVMLWGAMELELRNVGLALAEGGSGEELLREYVRVVNRVVGKVAYDIVDAMGLGHNRKAVAETVGRMKRFVASANNKRLKEFLNGCS